MICTQFYPVLMTAGVAETARFCTQHFGFAPQFESDWYVHLQSTASPEVHLAVLQQRDPTVPASHRAAAVGGCC